MKWLMQIRKLALELIFLAGAAVFVYGCWLAWRPLGFMVGGGVLAAVGFFAGYERPKARIESEG